MALVFERLDAVVEHLLQSSELEAQPLQLGRVQLIRLLAVRFVQPAEQFQETHFSRSFGFICQWYLNDD